MKRVWLAQAATQLKITAEALIEKLVTGKLCALGREYGEGLPQPIPPEHFAAPLRQHETVRQEDLDAIIQLELLPPDAKLPAVGTIWRGLQWVDPYYGEHPTERPRPATCLDIGASIIYADGEHAWTDIQIILPEGENDSVRAAAAKKAVGIDAYENYQRDTKKRTGCWASQPEEEAWAASKGYSVDSVRAARTIFRQRCLSAAEVREFSKPGRRRQKKIAP